jgi:hypothetical protein
MSGLVLVRVLAAIERTLRAYAEGRSNGEDDEDIDDPSPCTITGVYLSYVGLVRISIRIYV